MYDKMLTDCVRSNRTEKYLAPGQTHWRRAKYFPVQPSHSVYKYTLSTVTLLLAGVRLCLWRRPVEGALIVYADSSNYSIRTPC